MKLLAFDLEISTPIPTGADWDDYRPFGISVAATLPEDDVVKLWYGQGRPDGRPWDRMPHLQVVALAAYLQRKVWEGYTIGTFNGLHFDFSVLAEESGLHDDCVALALDHLDPMFDFFCHTGYAFSLQACARGLGTSRKGMSGALAPAMWLAGEYDEVKRYVTQDVRVTLEVIQRAQEIGGLQWVDSRSCEHSWSFPTGRILTPREAMALPLPRPPHWLRDPWPREHFTGWLGGA